MVVDIAYNEETKYVGELSCKFDYSCELYVKNKLLYMDILTNKYHLFETISSMKPVKIVIFFSGIEKNLTQNKYNMRFEELRAAAYTIKVLSHMEYGKLEETNMSDITHETFKKYQDRLIARSI